MLLRLEKIKPRLLYSAAVSSECWPSLSVPERFCLRLARSLRSRTSPVHVKVALCQNPVSWYGPSKRLILLPSVDHLNFQHLVCRCIVFHRSLFLKNSQETQISKSWWMSFSILLNKFPALSFGGIDVGSLIRFTALFSMNLQETHSKIYRRKDTLEFSVADFDILQTLFIDGR